MEQKTGAQGWPLVPSQKWPGELTLACPKCGSTRVMMSVQYPFRGSGPGGRGRLGDSGAMEYNHCEQCGHDSRYPAK